ncbi:nuclear pore complex protein Nup107 [Venturia canescens]|uniref:nuclear pore complex protein Nup107 n=1 Tax=Venturia canescens TaxID=32260 RepID=UPI001C9C52C6|nr:nuclear pore complex protein Nup107 [Venturia canescens]
MESRYSTKENLEQSIGLLSQKNAQRKSFLRLSTKSTTPKRISLQQSFTPKRVEDEEIRGNDTNTSMRNQFESQSKLLKHDLSDFDTSITLYPGERLSRSFRSAQHEVRDIMLASDKFDLSLREMMEDSASTGLILKSDKPWRKAALKLYHEFLEIIQGHSSEPQIFDTIADFIQNCTDTLQIMRGMQAKVDTIEMSEEEINLENERNTWRLVYCLYQNRLSSHQNFQTKMETDVNENLSEKNVIEALIRNESMIREYQLIIDWLEKNAVDQAETQPKIEHFTDKTIAWENTMHQLHNRQGGIMFGSSRPLVTSLDPDAPIREGKPLHDLDKEDDARLEKRMFIEVRCGRLQRAQELAVHCGQPWRAACLLGWEPYHDPNYNNPLTDTKLPVEGNPNRSLWKLCAWKISQDPRVGQYYRAIYASLCGNLQHLLTVAASWQDELWAYMKCLMDIEVESEVRGVMAKNYISMPDDYWKSKVGLEDIFANLQASKNAVVQSQACKPDHLIQKYLILDQVPQLLEQMRIWIDSGNSINPQFLRFLAHLVLFFRQIGKDDRDQIGDKVLLAYVRVLIEIGDPTLVAFYTATLPQEDQITNFANYLEGVKKGEERKLCLVAAEEANLNVEAITKLVVENVRQKNINLDTNGDLTGKLTESDLEKIDALDWVTFYPSQREEALWQGNALIRYFLTCGKVDAARKAFNKIPADAIEVIMNEHPSLEATLAAMTMTVNISKKTSASIREYLCYKAYLDAQEGFQEWFSHFYQGKPAPLDDLPSYATFTEKVAHDHKKAQYSAELERWKCTMQHHTKAVKQLLFNVLLFPDGGWLVDSSSEKVTGDESTPAMPLRLHQLNRLRSLCIPKITLLLLTVMSDMNEHAECVELSDILASEQYQLYSVFSKDKLREVTGKICESSLALMDQKKDPWGYPR